MNVERFVPQDAAEWDAFVAASRNGTFLLLRGYMDYHADRFVDHSLVFRAPDRKIVALLPANESAGDLHSHGGLTYGGLVLGARPGASDVLAMFAALRQYMAGGGIPRLLYKTIPSIYHRQPAEEDRYALFRCGASLVRRDVLSVVPGHDRLAYQERRARGVRKARGAGVTVAESQDFAAFWPILTENLMARFGLPPVHSLDEIQRLHALFPRHIRLFLASAGERPVAGVVVYESSNVAHVQYISAGDEGRRTHALDAIFDALLSTVYAAKPYFDFGISNEDQGRVLNAGLVEQKEGFGARSIVHDYYELSA